MVRLLCKRGCCHAGAGYCSSYFMPVGLLIRGLTTYMGWTSVGGARVRTALAEQRRSSPTTFARKVNPVSENDVWQMLGEQRLPAHRLTSPLFTVIVTVGATYRWLRLRR